MSIGNTVIPDAFLGNSPTRWRREIPFIIDSVLYFTEPKPKGKGRRENHRGFAVCSSSPSIPSSLPSLAVPPPSATLVMVAFFVLNLFMFGMAILQLCYGSLCSLILAMCSYLLIECLFSMSTAIMSSSYPRNFMKTDAMFLEFEDDLDNITGGLSSVGDDTAGSSSQQPATPTPRRRAHSRLLELERQVAINGRIPMTIAPGVEKPISPHAVRFSQAIGECVRKTFPIRYLKWADVKREYIEVVKGDLQRMFVFDFNDEAMNSTATPRRLVPNALVGRHEDWHFLCNHYISRAFQEKARTNKAARQRQPYNHSSSPSRFYNDSTSSLREKGSRSIVWSCSNKHMFELGRSCHRPPRMRIRPGYSKGLGWGPKPKAHRTTSSSSSSTSCSQSTQKEIELQAKLNEALERIEVQHRNHQALASQVETLKKMVEELTHAQ
ncbi:CACTA en-spm transposon protein [Cucumis melo var. makuwa]|uniref:CACTA en-spm transposon protein n=1 Tax=Cucumis melo var. makuwa TaxID=1194695 RepID=A0A5A7SSV3_CUCMM|nr:CACTA en-spm transposon protein [Cucumis melo var. makuwa]TYJ95656.1 CACTA en-spm transposon protein [Cucumis melo var. makuwa]